MSEDGGSSGDVKEEAPGNQYYVIEKEYAFT